MGLFRVLTIGVLLLCSWSVFAVNRATPIAQYSHTAWRPGDGSLSTPPTAIAQTKDGYLWIGTDTGLFRFDGVRFTPIDQIVGRQTHIPAVWSLYGASDGSLWVGSRRLLFHLSATNWTAIAFPNGSVHSITEDPAGRIWVSRSSDPSDLPVIGDADGGACLVAGQRLECHGGSAGRAFVSAFSSVVAPDGAKWFGCITAMGRYQDGKSTLFPIPALSKEAGLEGIQGLSVDPAGGLWVGFRYSGPSLGLEHFSDGRYRSIKHGRFDSTRLQVWTTFVDRDGSLWVGTTGEGIYRIRGTQVEQYALKDGLSSNSVRQIFQDREGSIWVISSNGIDRFRDLSVLTYSTAQHLSESNVQAVLALRNGSIWVSTVSGIDILRGQTVTKLGDEVALPGSESTSMLEDRNGDLWLGMDDTVYHLSHGKTVEIRQPDGRRMGGAGYIVQDTKGKIWISTFGHRDKSLFYIDPGENVAHQFSTQLAISRGTIPDVQSGIWILDRSDTLAHIDEKGVTIANVSLQPGEHMQHLLQGPDGTLYIWTGRGIVLVRGSERKLMGNASIGSCVVYSAAFDQSGSLWMGGQCGLLRVAGDQVRGWWNSKDSQIRQVRFFDSSDGAFPVLGSFSPAVSRSADGRLWFASDEAGGLQMVDPAHLPFNKDSPPVNVEDLIADRKRIAMNMPIRLAPLTREIEIDYTAMSFVDPQKVLFRYKLDGYDKDWEEAGTRRQAFYTNLSPGQYTFHVIACNNSGVWNEQGASLAFFVPPAWYQTVWFEVLVALVVLSLAWLFIRRRIHIAEREVALRFEAQMSERMRIARELHDTLLQSLQGLMLSFSSFIDQASAPPNVQRGMESALDRAEELLVSGRNRIHDLRTGPATEKTLASELDALIDRLCDDDAPKAKITFSGEPKRLRPIVLDEVVWILTEALTNACRHSGATEIELHINQSRDGLHCFVRDNGRGFNQQDARTESGHFGFVGMHERAERIGGRLQVQSSIGTGTTVGIAVPAVRAYEEASGWLRRLFPSLK